jgi:hypothetical protein
MERGDLLWRKASKIKSEDDHNRAMKAACPRIQKMKGNHELKFRNPCMME